MCNLCKVKKLVNFDMASLKIVFIDFTLSFVPNFSLKPQCATVKHGMLQLVYKISAKSLTTIQAGWPAPILSDPIIKDKLRGVGFTLLYYAIHGYNS